MKKFDIKAKSNNGIYKMTEKEFNEIIKLHIAKEMEEYIHDVALKFIENNLVKSMKKRR